MLQGMLEGCRRVVTKALVGRQAALHLGMPKTATTMLQEHLFPQHSQIYYLGKAQVHGPHRSRYTSEAAAEVVEGAIPHKHFSHRTVAQSRARYLREIRPQAGRRLVLWSSEQHTYGKRPRKFEEARRFRQILGPARVLIAVRHPLKWIESMYFERMKAVNVYSEQGHALGPGYYTIDQWLESMATERNVAYHLSWLDTLEAYCEAFGQPNVGVFLFEEMVRDNGAFLRSIAKFLGIDGEEAATLAAGKRSNDRWTAKQWQRFQEVAADPVQWQAFLQAPQLERREMLGINDDAESASGPKATTTISPAWQEQLLERARPGAQRIAAEWGLPLAQYGYPL